jgi:hypothetical protein
MSIQRRVEDALELHRLNRFEGALLCALVAAAATASKEQPNRNVGDRECFEAFLAKGAFQRIGEVEFRGRLHAIPHIFYKWLRCELVHEGSVPIDIEFIGDKSSGVLSLRAGGAPSYVLQLSHGWLFEILHLVKISRANEESLQARSRTSQ